MHANQLLLVLGITCECMHSTHAHPTDSQASGDTLSGDMRTELTSSREDIIPTEPVSSGEPPSGSKACACSNGETKGKECRLKITPTGIVNLLESIANKENNKVYLRITGKHCDGEVTKKQYYHC